MFGVPDSSSSRVIKSRGQEFGALLTRGARGLAARSVPINIAKSQFLKSSTYFEYLSAGTDSSNKRRSGFTTPSPQSGHVGVTSLKSRSFIHSRVYSFPHETQWFLRYEP